VTTVGAIEGRKSLIVVSSGLELSPGIALFEYVADLCPAHDVEIRREIDQYALLDPLRAVTARANAGRVTLHSLDAGGLRALDSASVRAQSSRYRLSAQASRLKIANLQSGLFTLAEDTGGRTILNENQPFEALGKVRQDVESGYVLGFTLDRPLDRRVHKLKVVLKTPRKDWELSYRRSYVDREEEEILVGRLLAALQLDHGENPLGIHATAGAPVLVEKRVVEVPVKLLVPAEAVPAAAENELRAPRVRVLGVAIDSKGRRTVVRQGSLPLPEPIDGTYLFEIRMKLEPERYRIGVSLELEDSARTSYVVVESDLTDAAPVEAES
jgi:hypothetical protein